MTTEIAVLNRLGLALATDSAVTIGGGAQNKIFDSADKLFELSPLFPVAVMINGNMDCLGVPWEIIIKDFREECGFDARDSVGNWMEDFLNYVDKYKSLNDSISEKNIHYKVLKICKDLEEGIAKGFVESFGAKRGNTKSPVDFEQAIREYRLAFISDRQELYDKDDKSESLSKVNVLDVCKSYDAIIDRSIKEVCVSNKPSSIELEKLKLLISTVIMSNEQTEYTTGIVIAGYGKLDNFPAISTVEIEGKVLGYLKYTKVNDISIEDAETAGRVVSFAQTDVIDRLLGGADPAFVEETAIFIRDSVIKTCTDLEESWRGRRISAREIQKRSRTIVEIANFIHDMYKDKTANNLISALRAEFEHMIALMPKQELVELAEALVNITAVERKASSDQGTVGGPIDVALLTKHEGFVWIKRKQHFDAALNPRYFWRRYGRVSPGGNNVKNSYRSHGKIEESGVDNA